MKPSRGIASLLVAALAALAADPAAAQGKPGADFPNRTVRIVIPQAAGSGIDIMTRLVAQKLTESWGQQVIVDNRPGANGIIGIEAVTKTKPDGYTLCMAFTSVLAINPHIYKTLPYDTFRDFTPISQAVTNTIVLIVHPTLPARSVKELVALAKARPGQLNYASGGVGSAQHIPMEMLKSMTGINIVHVSYKGLTPAFNDVVAGQVPMMIPGVVTALPLHQAGRLRIIATTAAKRTAATPDIPTIAESGVPGFDWDSWTGFLAPAGTPPQVIARVHAEVVRITRLPETSEKLPGFEWIGSTPQEFGSYIKANLARIGKVVREANIKAE